MRSTNPKSGLLMLAFLLGMVCTAGAVELWDITLVDRKEGVGGYSSLAILPSGQPAISYYDSTNDDLKYAWYDGNTWQTITVDSAGDVGKYTSLAILLSGQPAISYYDYTNRDLKYARYDGNTWQTTTIDSEGYVGEYTSLAILQSGYPSISYFDRTNRDLKYAWYDGTAWHTTTLDSEGDIGIGTSLAVLPSGMPAVSYRYAWSYEGLKYAELLGSDPCDPNDWQITIIDDGDISGNISLAILTSGHPAISYGEYIPFADDKLKYAWYDGGTWYTTTLSSEEVSHTSLVVLPSGRPAISYPGGRFIYDYLKYAELVGSDPCDPNQWQNVIVDSQGGYGPSMAVLPSGQPAISYYGAGSYYRVGGLRLASDTVLPAPVAMSADYIATAWTSQGGKIVAVNGPALSVGEYYIEPPGLSAWEESRVKLEVTDGGHLRGLIGFWAHDGEMCWEDPFEGWICHPACFGYNANGTLTGTLTVGSSGTYPAGSPLGLTMQVLVEGEPGDIEYYIEYYHLRLRRGDSLIGQIDPCTPDRIPVPVFAGETLSFDLFASGADGCTGLMYGNRVFELRMILSEQPPPALDEAYHAETTLVETINSQVAVLENATVTGDLNGVLDFNNLEIVTIATGPFAGKGFSKGQFQTTLDGIPYQGDWKGVLYLKPEERKMYVRGAISGEISATVEGHLTESVPDSNTYDQYQATWKIGRLGGYVTSATINLNGNLSYQSNSEFPSTELYVLQTNVEGTLYGHYRGPLSTVVNHLRIVDGNNPYSSEGFSIISYTSTSGTGQGLTYDTLVSPGRVESRGLFTSPLFGIANGVLVESGILRALYMTVTRVDLGLPPAPDLKVKTWGPTRVSPGQTVNYIIEYRNDGGLKTPEDTDLVVKLPYEVEFVSATGSGTYKRASHEVAWYLGNIDPKHTGRLSVEVRVLWGLPFGTSLENVASSPKMRVEVAVDPNIGVHYEIIDANESQLRANVALSKPNQPDILVPVELSYEDVLDWTAPTFEYIETPNGIEFQMQLTVRGSLKEWEGRLKFPKLGLDVILAAKDVQEYTEGTVKYGDFLNWLLVKNESIAIDKHAKLSNVNLCIGAARSVITGLDLTVGSKLPGSGWALQKLSDWAEREFHVRVGAAIYEHTVGPLPDGWKKNREFTKQLKTLHDDRHKSFVAGTSHDIDSHDSRVDVARDPNRKLGRKGRVLAGQRLKYKVEYENEGEGIAFGVYVTDTLDEDLDDSALQIGPVIDVNTGEIIAGPGTYNPATRTITWFVGQVDPNQGGYADLSVNVRDDAPHGTEIINFATVYFPSVPEETRTNGIVSIVANPCVEALTLEGYELVDEQRISRTEFEYTFRLRAENTSIRDVNDTTVQLIGVPSNTTILDDTVEFSFIAAGAEALSDDTFKIRTDRTVEGLASDVVWEIGDCKIDWGADLNYDWFVNFEDYAILAEVWLSTGVNMPQDLYPDSRIDQKDLLIFSQEWLK